MPGRPPSPSLAPPLSLRTRLVRQGAENFCCAKLGPFQVFAFLLAFGRRPAPGWVEVAKESRKGSVALAVVGDADKQVVAAGVEAALDARSDADDAVPIMISANGICIEFPHEADAGDLAAVLKKQPGRPHLMALAL